MRGLCPLGLLPLMTEFSVFMSLQGVAPGNSLTGGVSLKDYKIIWKIKIREIKIILEDFNCTMDKMDRDSENKTERLCWCCSSYALSKFILDNGLEDLRRRENPDSPEFTCYDRSFGKDPG